ncbi:MAG: alpha/beta hydrolase [Chloroflexi bacterium]|nr:alpha/beta hydrolase [Chloroflexota bacterium]
MFETAIALSRDGTRIAFDRRGSGSPIIFVVGAFNERPTAAPLAESLADRFSTFTYDRRGRGESGDTPPYAVEREIEDLTALIEVAGGSASVFGYSSGAMLALQSAAAGLPISRLVLYDPPYLANAHDVDHTEQLAQLIAHGKRGEAVEYFQSKLVGIPDAVIAQLRQAPFRPALERMAHTLVYESMLLRDRALPPAEVASRVVMPTLALAGGAGSPILPAAATALARRLPNAKPQILPDVGHDLDTAVLGPVLARFFGAETEEIR